MNPNVYLEHVYPGPQPPCWQLVTDVYLNELALPVNQFRTVNNSIRAIASAFRIAIHKAQHGFEQIPEPADMCVVLLGKTAKIGLHHCGVYLSGSVLHALPTMNLYQDVVSIRDEYALIEFWAPAP